MSQPRELFRSVEQLAARTPTLPPATHTNSYAIGARDVLLVEPATPYADEQRAWMAWARALPSRGRRAIAILATHHHADHVGGAIALTRELGLPLWAHAETASRIEAPVSRTVADGDEIVLEGPIEERWTVLHTPGHAPGHVCLRNADERVLVVGDMVASVGTILIDPVDGDMAAYLDQLDRLAGLDAQFALPAHGEPIENPTALFRWYAEHRRAREARIFGVIVSAGTGGAAADEIVMRAYDDVPAVARPLALLSVLAHMKKLVAEGRVREADGARYVAAA